MIQFKKVRLHGFKSFVEKTEFEIGPGLTGIVGPNGCGKSNLVEALRWSMGETSSKRMRGNSGSMEDVIFNGTATRPARNMAEVSVLLDNTARTAPAAFNGSDEIEVIRKIERDHGSGYKINGKNVRARDVQLLYADILSGANSPFLVSQGKVTAIIQAKPLDRRMILEEAAGITGLYARRHEAELRLRAADANMKRVEDLVASMETRLNDLRKQGRQATRYRNLSGQIRQLEIMIATLEWRAAHEALREVNQRFAVNESTVAEKLTVVSQLTRTQTTQSEDIPALRQNEAEMAAALQTLRLAMQRLEDEQTHITGQIEEFRTQTDRIAEDRVHEQQTLAENGSILERLDSEEKSIHEIQGGEDTALMESQSARDSMKEKVSELETRFTAQMEKLAADRARRISLERQIEHDRARWNGISQRLESVKAQLAAKKAETNEDSLISSLRTDIESAQVEAETLRASIEGLREAVVAARALCDNARIKLQETENRRSKLSGEIKAVESVIESFASGTFRPVFDDVAANPGFETALSRALGDTLMASTEPESPAVWEGRSDEALSLPSLPAGLVPLKNFVNAPRELHLALALIGFAETDQAARDASTRLQPGQSVVSRSGAYWRWDGLHMKAAASDRNALQLAQKNSLIELQKQLPDADTQAETARKNLASAEDAYKDAQTKLDETQHNLNTLDGSVRDKTKTLSNLIETQASRQAELAKLTESLSLAEADLKILAQTVADSEAELSVFDDSTLENLQSDVDTLRSELLVARENLQDAIRVYDSGLQEQSRRKARLQAIGDERINIQNRNIRANERLKELEEREQILKTKLDDLKRRPAEIKKESESLLSGMTEREQGRAAAADKLAAAESELAETNKALKAAESDLAEAREQRAHAIATREERMRQMDAIVAHINEQFAMAPEGLAAEAALDEESMPQLDELKQKKEKSLRERDGIGPVNLRAEQEMEDLDRELTGILNERNDLTEAINELRQGIQKLNHEARERLNQAFDKVNAHFRDMFTRLFNGGKAHLSLIESDDPLEAGLEIFAQPPGKTLQSLSLLSGGEQTLTAVALIFAMFLTNPAPICVLDEVDAPLDDANVDRFCDMLEEFAERGQTRFLIITHHRLTMARMDRLYGVTMTERGVSQLVSVDMNKQLDFLEAAE